MSNINTVNQKESNTSSDVHPFEKNSVLSTLIKTAIPIIILMLFNSAYAFVDSIMSATYVQYGDLTFNGIPVTNMKDVNEALTGATSIGFIFPLMGIISSFEVMLAVGSGLAYTEAMAKKDYNGAKQRQLEGQTMIVYMGILMFFVIAIIGIPYLLTVSGNWDQGNWGDATWGVVDGSGTNRSMVMDGYYYMLILGISFIPMQLSQQYVRVIRAEGKGNASAIIPILTLPINVLLDWLLMSQFGIGLIGAGVATLVANLIGMFMLASYVWYMGNKEQIKLRLAKPKVTFHREIAIVIMIFAAGSFVRRIFDSTTVITLSTYVGNISASNSSIEEVSIWHGSWTMMTRSTNMGIALSLGSAQAMSVLISYYNSKNEKDKVGEVMKYGSLMMIVATLLAITFLFGMQGILFKGYQIDRWEWWNPLSIAFIFVLLYTIPSAIQPMGVMFYSGTKRVKYSISHAITYNLIVISIVSIGFIINLQTGQPLVLFGSMVIGAFVGLTVVMIMLRYRYYKYINDVDDAKFIDYINQVRGKKTTNWADIGNLLQY